MLLIKVLHIFLMLFNTPLAIKFTLFASMVCGPSATNLRCFLAKLKNVEQKSDFFFLKLLNF